MSEFHIHIDALFIDEDFEKYLLTQLNFKRCDFSGSPAGVKAYAPAHHFTLKLQTSLDFRQSFKKVVSRSRPDTIKGYIEGEFVAVDNKIKENPFDNSVSVPFIINTASLPYGTFRESEIHITLNRDKSHPSLLQNLLKMGLHTVFMPKDYGIAQIFTVQGSRKDIKIILPRLSNFLDKSGGAIDCSIKEERTAAWWMSSPDYPLAPVINEIQWSL